MDNILQEYLHFNLLPMNGTTVAEFTHEFFLCDEANPLHKSKGVVLVALRGAPAPPGGGGQQRNKKRTED
jgi:hypothetical protein